MKNFKLALKWMFGAWLGVLLMAIVFHSKVFWELCPVIGSIFVLAFLVFTIIILVFPEKILDKPSKNSIISDETDTNKQK